MFESFGMLVAQGQRSLIVIGALESFRANGMLAPRGGGHLLGSPRDHIMGPQPLACKPGALAEPDTQSSLALHVILNVIQAEHAACVHDQRLLLQVLRTTAAGVQIRGC